MIIGTELISQNTQELLTLPLTFIPQFIIAVAILIAGWIIGWLVERVIISIFKVIPFVDDSLRSVGLEEITKRAGLRINLGKFFGSVIKIFIIFVFLVASLDVLGLETVNNFVVDRILGYIPSVVSAALVLVIGLVIAGFSSRFVEGASRAANISGGFAAKITKWSIVVFSVIIAVGELGIANEIIQSMIVGIIAAISLALGLSFGIGGQKAASDFLDRFKGDI